MSISLYITRNVSSDFTTYTSGDIIVSIRNDIQYTATQTLRYKIKDKKIYDEYIDTISCLIDNAAYVQQNCAIYNSGKLVVKAGHPSFIDVIKFDLNYTFEIYDTYIVTDYDTAYIVGAGFHAIC